MLEQPNYSKKYYLKIVLLIVIGAVAELVVWYTMVREESVDWIGNKVLDQPYAYVITEIDDGRTVVGNVIEGYEVTTPKGFTVVPAEQPAFLYKEDEETVCRIESNLAKYKTSIHTEKVIENQGPEWVKSYAGINVAYKQENSEDGSYSYDLKIPVDNLIIEYYLTSEESYKNKCKAQLDKIRTSFIYY